MRDGFRVITLTAMLVLLTGVSASNAQTLPEMRLYAVTTAGEMISFDSSKPGKLLKTPKINGLTAGEKLVGIDFRPSNKMLYGVTNQSKIYTIDTTTGAALAAGTLTTALTGGIGYGVDFNPVPDRLRITNDADQNLRANPVDAVNVVDKTLIFAATDANTGKNPNIGASAYTNNVAGAKVTTLYNIDYALDVLLTQIPPNDGVLNTVGILGVKITGNAGFDIVSRKDMNLAIAALHVEGEKTSKLFIVDLQTGSATLVGKIGVNSLVIGLTASF